MCLFHKWGKWRTTVAIQTFLKWSYEVGIQVRECERCGKIQIRRLDG